MIKLIWPFNENLRSFSFVFDCDMKQSRYWSISTEYDRNTILRKWFSFTSQLLLTRSETYVIFVQSCTTIKLPTHRFFFLFYPDKFSCLLKLSVILKLVAQQLLLLRYRFIMRHCVFHIGLILTMNETWQMSHVV